MYQNQIKTVDTTEPYSLTGKLSQAVHWTQETVHALGEKIGLLSQSDAAIGTEEFSEEIAEGASEMHPNMNHLEQLDAKYDTEAKIYSTDRKLDVEIDVDKSKTIGITTEIPFIHIHLNRNVFNTEAFRREVEQGAAEMHPNMKILHQFDEKYDIGAHIGSVNAVRATVVKTDLNENVQQGAVHVNTTTFIPEKEHDLRNSPVSFGTEIERGAAEIHAANVIETRKEGLNSAIDAGAEKIKNGIEEATKKTIDVALATQENVYWTKDMTQQNVDLVKEKAQYAIDLAKEKARQNLQWTKAKTEEGTEKLIEVVRKTPEIVQEGTILLGEKIGLIQPIPKDFNQAIKIGADQMQPDMNTLQTFDEKYQLDAEIETVNTVDFNTAIARGARKIETTHNIDAAKEDALSIIDVGAAKLKHAIEVVAEGTKAVALRAHDNVNETSDQTRLNVELAKEGASRNVSLVKEKAKENYEWAKAKTYEGKDKFIQKTQELMHVLGEQIKTLPQTVLSTSQNETDFDTAISKGAADMTVDMEALNQFDAKYELDANINTVHKTDFNTAIQRGATKAQTTHKIESAKEGICNAIDTGVEKLKQGIELVADNTKAVSHTTHKNIYSIQDAIQPNNLTETIVYDSFIPSPEKVGLLSQQNTNQYGTVQEYIPVVSEVTDANDVNSNDMNIVMEPISEVDLIEVPTYTKKIIQDYQPAHYAKTNKST
jgi:hypothetical protein